MKTKKVFKSILLITMILALTVSFTACSKSSTETNSNASKETKNIKVGVCAGPYGDMFTEAITPSLEAKGYKVQLVQFSDYVQPNKALANKEIDVNMFQHSVYLKNFAKENSLDITYITEIPTAGMGIFSSKYKSLDELPAGATVAIPNDPTNLSRALRVLQQANLVKIDPSVDPAKADEKNLSENPKKLKITLIEAPQLPRTLDSADIAVINGNFAISAGLKLADALYKEVLSDGYVNVIAVRTEDVQAQFAKDIVESVKSDAFKKVIEDPSKQYSSFQKPKDY